MKKLFITLSLLLTLSTLSAMSMQISMGMVTSKEVTPVYTSVALVHKIDALVLEGAYSIGYDVQNHVGYTGIIVSAGLAFDWGKVSLSKEYTNDVNQTCFLIEFAKIGD